MVINIKKSGICPKCNSKNVYQNAAKFTQHLPISSMSQVAVNHYFCTECGYTEAYVATDKDLEKIKKKLENMNEN